MIRITPENINTVEYWDNRYKTDGGPQWDVADIPKKIASRVPQNARIMDVGVGAAWVYKRLCVLRPDLVFYGCDHSGAVIDLLKNASLPFKFSGLFQMSILFQDAFNFGPYDVVIATEVLEHVEFPELAVKNMAQAALDKVIVTVPKENWITSPEHVWSYTVEDLTRLLEPYGKSVEVFTVRDERNLMGVLCR